jgi:hypothetical protein
LQLLPIPGVQRDTDATFVQPLWRVARLSMPDEKSASWSGVIFLVQDFNGRSGISHSFKQYAFMVRLLMSRLSRRSIT